MTPSQISSLLHDELKLIRLATTLDEFIEAVRRFCSLSQDANFVVARLRKPELGETIAISNLLRASTDVIENTTMGLNQKISEVPNLSRFIANILERAHDIETAPKRAEELSYRAVS